VKLGIGICAASLLVLMSSAFGQNVVKQEPGAGALSCGATILVDDGTCGRKD